MTDVSIIIRRVIAVIFTIVFSVSVYANIVHGVEIPLIVSVGMGIITGFYFSDSMSFDTPLFSVSSDSDDSSDA